jgi:hypothetical protein
MLGERAQQCQRRTRIGKADDIEQWVHATDADDPDRDDRKSDGLERPVADSRQIACPDVAPSLQERRDGGKPRAEHEATEQRVAGFEQRPVLARQMRSK